MHSLMAIATLATLTTSALVLDVTYDGEVVPLEFEPRDAFDEKAQAWLGQNPQMTGAGCEAGDTDCIVTVLVDAMTSLCETSGEEECVKEAQCDDPTVTQTPAANSTSGWAALAAVQSLVLVALAYDRLRSTRPAKPKAEPTPTWRRTWNSKRKHRSTLPRLKNPTPVRPRPRSATPLPVRPGSSQHKDTWRAMWEASFRSGDDDVFDAWYADIFPDRALDDPRSPPRLATPEAPRDDNDDDDDETRNETK